jgi:hypothetical protein
MTDLNSVRMSPTKISNSFTLSFQLALNQHGTSKLLLLVLVGLPALTRLSSRSCPRFLALRVLFTFTFTFVALHHRLRSSLVASVHTA